MRLPEKFCIVIEYGSSYSDDSWEPVAVCSNEAVANKWIEITANKKGVNKSMYHKTKVPYVFSAEASTTKTLFPDDEIDDDYEEPGNIELGYDPFIGSYTDDV